jgi:hypothetical protein
VAKLSEKQKRAVPKSQRGVPSKSGTGSYPMPDKKHARAAIMLSGKAPASERAAIKAKARKVLAGKGK